MPDLLRWTKRHLTCHISLDATFGTLTRNDILACCEWAWSQWTAVCGVHVQIVQDAPGDIRIISGDIDGPWGTVAFSAFPDGSDNLLTIKFDKDEKWVARRPPNAWRIDLGQCMLHEFGHALGIPHLPGICVMSTMYDRSLLTLQRDDISEAIARYGVRR